MRSFHAFVLVHTGPYSITPSCIFRTRILSSTLCTHRHLRLSEGVRIWAETRQGFSRPETPLLVSEASHDWAGGHKKPRVTSDTGRQVTRRAIDLLVTNNIKKGLIEICETQLLRARWAGASLGRKILTPSVPVAEQSKRAESQNLSGT